MASAIRSTGQISYPFLSAGAFTAALAVRETGPGGAPKPRLLDRVREAIGARHYSHRTEKAYIHWTTWSASPASVVVTTSMNPFSSAR